MALATAKTCPGSDRLHVSRFARTGVLWAALVAFSSLFFCLLRWGGYLLIATDPLPTHVDAAVVLQGSTSAHIARIGGAVHLLRAGVRSEERRVGKEGRCRGAGDQYEEE